MSRRVTVIVINGYPGSGKDSFVKAVRRATANEVVNLHASDKAKAAFNIMGWDGVKTADVRNALASFIITCNALFDTAFKHLADTVKHLEDSPYSNVEAFVFVHEREPKNIARILEAYPNAVAMIVKRPGINHATNENDAGVENFEYAICIENKGDLDELDQLARAFAECMGMRRTM